ncbi:MAG: FAD-dependent thymidylate synthase [Roseiflexaceae bacterium]
MNQPVSSRVDVADPHERALIAPYVTDLDAPIFGLRNLPEVVKGALFSRYSRSDKSLRRMLIDEFITAPESGFAEIAAEVDTARASDQLVAVRQAEAFYDRVLVGYGDDSVAELGGAHIACEGISNIAAKVIEDSRIGISPLEKSTRYVVFNRKVAGQYRYLREPAIMESSHAAAYITAMDGLFDTYSALLDPVMAFVRQQTPRDATTSERAYASATRAKACDILRGLLPMATLTNVGLFGNGRAFEHLLNRLYSSDLAELQAIASQAQAALDGLIPSFVKRPKTDRGRQGQTYRRTTRHATAALVQQILATQPTVSAAPAAHAAGVTLVDYDANAEQRVLAAILYAATGHNQDPEQAIDLATMRGLAATLSAEQQDALLRSYTGERQSRFQRPGRAFEEARYSFDIVADIGAYRDLQRHRMLSQERQSFAANLSLGFVLPPEISQAGLSEPFSAALSNAARVAEQIAASLPEAAQYAVPMAFRMRWRMTMNLRELYHLAELRSAPQGHPAYRRVAQAMYALVADIHPRLTAAMRFVDMGDYALERLAAEQRLDQKLVALRPDRSELS